MPLSNEPVPMPGKKITFKKASNGTFYVYYTLRAYRNKQGRPTSDEVAIGKKDPVTGMLIPNRRYYELFQDIRVEAKGEGSAIPTRVASCGTTFLLMHLTGAIGLRGALEKCFPDRYAQMLAAAFYILCEGNVMMYMEDWFDETDVPFTEHMDDQQCSRLFASITHNERMRFFREWVRLRSEQEYIAYDVTSISTSSKGIEIAEWGYNRDGESIPQVNLGMFYGAESRLPVYYNLYSGSITDKSHLPFMMEGASKLGIGRVRFVLDRGFVTEANLKYMEQEGHLFVTAFPQNLLEAKRLIDRCKNSIRKAANRIGQFGVYGKSVDMDMYGSRLKVHVYFDTEKQALDEKELYAHIERLESELEKMGKAKRVLRRYTDYFVVEEEKAGRLKFRQDSEKVDAQLSRAGFFILLSNDLSLDSGEVLSIYRGRDAIEKSFDQLKNGIDFRRLRTHANKTTDGKVFIGFLSLALRSCMMKKLKESKALKHLALDKALLELRKIKFVTYDGSTKLLMPLTKLQRDVLESMGSSEIELRNALNPI
jgi:transposase